MIEIDHPLAQKVARRLKRNHQCITRLSKEQISLWVHGLLLQAQHISYLRGEDGDGNTAGKTHDNGVRDEFDHCPQLEDTEQHQHHASH